MLERLRVLLLGQRVDRPELLAASRQTLQAGPELLALLGTSGSLGRDGFERQLASPAGSARSARRPPGRGHAEAGPRPSVSTSLSRCSCAWSSASSLGARAKLGGDVLARLPIGGEVGVEPGPPVRDRLTGVIESRDQGRHRAGQSLVALQ